MSGVLALELAWRTPECLFRSLGQTSRVVWFDSQTTEGPRSRHSYLCVDPFGVIEASGGRVLRDGTELRGDPFTILGEVLAGWPRLQGEWPTPFVGGAAGFFGYELGGHLERLPAPKASGTGCDCWIGLYDVVIGFDHLEQRCWLTSSGLPQAEPGRRSARAAARLAEWRTRLMTADLAPLAPCEPAPAGLGPIGWTHDRDRAAYVEAVREALGLIEAGDIFQVNLTTRDVAPLPEHCNAEAIHLALRKRSPAPFGAFLRGSSDFAICCVSPERFLSLDRHGRIETRPIKGSRPRAADPAEDLRRAQDLLGSEKDRAENLMIVDLMRNDLGRVAAAGSVRVESLQQVESFASLHHMVSAIAARLKPGLHAIDLLRAAFPGGSVTGAPKIRAMEIIHGLECARRGPYCGSIAWIGVDGAMDSNIVIRSLVIEAGRMIAQAGGAIVADSVPEDEFAEMLDKIAPMHAIFAP